MRVYEQKIKWKRVLFIVALLIGAFSLWYTNKLVQKLATEEEKKVLLWANATKQLINANENTDINFLLDIIKDNETIPVILVDDNGEITANRNLDSAKAEDKAYLNKQLAEMKLEREPIKILYDEANEKYNYLYYKNSIILIQLKQYPYYQLSIIALFILVAYLAFSYSRKSEQNQVWVGMSKETAHQLGTPISSLNGWINLLRDMPQTKASEEILVEFEKDLQRLELITERFSKIGSVPVLVAENIFEVMERAIDYLKTRSSTQVIFSVNSIDKDALAMLNVPLFDWVVENICKNAIDAMSGVGKINVNITTEADKVYIDIQDTGKGIAASKQKTVFKPGYTTKKRGWGLGLSLTKRIIEDYHQGKVFVLESNAEKGTTFRIVLRGGGEVMS
ncbi:MAG: HAMP domain-containing histidine kinase [Bacteroidia bacterium]|nr:HAMP domain-containing histidine kinase [Bacteroidia bacterium]MBP9689691.1 HAMP domain-containing histidine kinase [Bacteroidia bacterium]